MAARGLAGEMSAGLRALGLPTHVPGDLAANTLLEAMRLDKKTHGNPLRFALPTAIGVMARDDGRWTIAIDDSAAIVHALRAAGAA